MGIRRLPFAIACLFILSGCPDDPPKVTELAGPCGPGSNTATQVLGAGIYQCDVQNVDPQVKQTDVAVGTTYTQLTIDSKLDNGIPILKGAAARSFYDKIVQVLGHSKDVTVGIEISPSIIPAIGNDPIPLPTTVIATLSYSDTSATGPAWITETKSHYASPLLILQPSSSIDVGIKLKASTSEKSEIKANVDSLNKGIVGLFPTSSAALNVVSQVTGWFDSGYNSFLKGFVFYDEKSHGTFSVLPLQPGKPRYGTIVLTTPTNAPLDTLVISSVYSRSLTQFPVESIKAIEPLDWSKFPDLKRGLKVVKPGANPPTQISVGAYLDSALASQLATLARHGSATNIDDIDQFCNDASEKLDSDLGLNIIDIHGVLNQEFYSSAVNLSRFSLQVRQSSYCIRSVAATVDEQNGPKPLEAATGPAVWTIADSEAFGTQFLVGAPSKIDVSPRLTDTITLIDTLNGSYVVSPIPSAQLQQSLSRYSITSQACYTVPSARDSNGNSTQVSSSRIIVGNSSTLGNIAFELQPTADVAANDQDKLGVIIVRKATEKDYSPQTDECKKLKKLDTST